MKHLLSIEAMDTASIETILENATVIKAQRGDSQHQPPARRQTDNTRRQPAPL